MQQSKQKNFALGTILVLSLTSTAQATLIDQGGGLIYDDVLDITWLQDANYAFTSGYAAANAVDSGASATDNILADGRMGWDAANTWAADLVFGGYDDWRLPTMIDTGTSGCNFANSGTDCGFNVQTASGGTNFSEMAHMYHNNLGLKSIVDASGTLQSDYGVFGNGTTRGEKDFALVQNVQSMLYWSDVPYTPEPTTSAWAFGAASGDQNSAGKTFELYSWAVRSGNVTGSVPTPVPFWLIGGGLMGLIGWKRKR